METIAESIYDHPKYYDLVFGSDCAAEMKFIQNVNKEFLDGSAKQLFEPACGTCRLMYGLAKKGFDVEGICLLYTSPSPRDQRGSRMPSSA